MNRDDIRKLIGGYATGSLTEAERKLLFDAALDDQDLFDELAHEQALKEMLDEPGVKQRLIAALKPEPVAVAWWRRPLVWSAAMVVAAGVVATSWVATRPARNVQVAQMKLPATTPAPADLVIAPAPPRLLPKAKAAAKRVPAQAAEQPAGYAKTEVATLALPAPTPIPQPPVPQPAVPQPPVPQTSPAVPPPVAPAPMQNGFASSGQSVGGVSRDRIEASRAAPLMAPRAAAAKRASRFGFDYTLEPAGDLVIKAAVDGYLTVGTLFPEAFVAKDSTTRIALSGSREVTIQFSAQRQAAVAAPPLPIRRETSSGTVDDPNPSPNSNLIVTLTLK